MATINNNLSKQEREVLNQVDTNFRFKFSDQIIYFKTKTLECQVNCYKKYSTDLRKSEICSKDCSLPYFAANTNISLLISKARDIYISCTETSTKDKCLNLYEKKLDNSTDEINFIYKGFLNKLNLN